MRKLLTIFLIGLIPSLGLSGHHEESNSPVAYVLTMGVKSSDLAGTAQAAGKFLDSGALAKRNVGMGLYGLNAKGDNPATMIIEYIYPNGESLPSPNVLTVSEPHVAFNKAQRAMGNEIISSTLYSSVYEVIPPETLETNKVFYAYYLQVSDPAEYLKEWKTLMKEMQKAGLGSDGYGIREVVAGGENGETHMIWMGYPSMAKLVDNFKATNSTEMVSEFMSKVSGIRTVTRTAIVSQLALSTAEIF